MSMLFQMDLNEISENSCAINFAEMHVNGDKQHGVVDDAHGLVGFRLRHRYEGLQLT